MVTTTLSRTEEMQRKSLSFMEHSIMDIEVANQQKDRKLDDDSKAIRLRLLELDKKIKEGTFIPDEQFLNVIEDAKNHIIKHLPNYGGEWNDGK